MDSTPPPVAPGRAATVQTRVRVSGGCAWLVFVSRPDPTPPTTWADAYTPEVAERVTRLWGGPEAIDMLALFTSPEDLDDFTAVADWYESRVGAQQVGARLGLAIHRAAARRLPT